jgi:hypothetical protein
LCSGAILVTKTVHDGCVGLIFSYECIYVSKLDNIEDIEYEENQLCFSNKSDEELINFLDLKD